MKTKILREKFERRDLPQLETEHQGDAKCIQKAINDDYEIVEEVDGKEVSVDFKYKSAPAEKGATEAEQIDLMVKALNKSQDTIVEKSAQKIVDAVNKNATARDIKVGKDSWERDPNAGIATAAEYVMLVKSVGGGKNGLLQEPTDKRLRHLRQKAIETSKLELHRDEEGLLKIKSLSTYGAEGTGIDGGFAVIPTYLSEIQKYVQAEGNYMELCSNIQIAGNGLVMPKDETTPWGTAGPQAYWGNEGVAYTQSKPKLETVEYKLKKVTALVPLTDELMEDAPAMAAYVAETAGGRINYMIGNAIFRGNGTVDPLGFLTGATTSTAASIQTIARAGTGAIATADLTTMLSYMPEWFLDGAAWFIHPTVIPSLFGLTVGNYPVFFPIGGVQTQGAQIGSLFTKPVYVSQLCRKLGAVGDMIFANMKQYQIVSKTSGMQAFSSPHLWFDQDAVAFKFRMRLDGAPKWRSGIAQADTNVTTKLSPFVAIAV